MVNSRKVLVEKTNNKNNLFHYIIRRPSGNTYVLVDDISFYGSTIILKARDIVVAVVPQLDAEIICIDEKFKKELKESHEQQQ